MSGALLMAAAGSQRFLLADTNIADTEAAPTTAIASISIQRGGRVVMGGNGSDPDYDWIDPKFSTVGDNYTIELTLVSGNPPTSGPALATIHALSTDRTWQWGVLSGSLGFTGTLELRTAGGVLLATKTLTASADSI